MKQTNSCEVFSETTDRPIAQAGAAIRLPIDDASIRVHVIRLPISEVRLSDERRARLNETVIATLVSSIRRRGLLSPVRVTRNYTLCCGAHRLVAHERLGLPEIDVIVAEGDEIDLELDELEENLARRELTVLERAIGEKRRKELYLLRNPETRAGVAGALARHSEVQAKRASFASTRAAETKTSKRAVEQRIQIAGALTPEATAVLLELPIADNHRQLLTLARVPADIRDQVVHRLASNPKESVAAVVSVLRGDELLPRNRGQQTCRIDSPLAALTAMLEVACELEPGQAALSEDQLRRITWSLDQLGRSGRAPRSLLERLGSVLEVAGAMLAAADAKSGASGVTDATASEGAT